jgi:formate dehydrogenase major subunit
MSYWQNYPKFHVSLMKAWYGPAATAENNWAFDYLPKLDKQYDMLQVFELMNQGKVNGYIAQGFNPLAALSNKDRVRDGLAKLKFLVIMDPLATETSEFWKNHGEFNDVETDKIQTDGVPPAHHLLRRRRGRWFLARAAVALEGAEPPGEAHRHPHHVGPAPAPARDVRQGRRQVPDPITKLWWPYAKPRNRPGGGGQGVQRPRWWTCSIPRTRPR